MALKVNRNMPSGRLCSMWTAALVVSVAIAVFAWGLQSKLSLYGLPAPGHAQPAPKLIHDKQEQKKSLAPLAVERRLPSEAAVLDEKRTTPACSALWRERRLHSVDRAPAPTVTWALFFRPPPSIAWLSLDTAPGYARR
jgi:hypothetical protein